MQTYTRVVAVALAVLGLISIAIPVAAIADTWEPVIIDPVDGAEWALPHAVASNGSAATGVSHGTLGIEFLWSSNRGSEQPALEGDSHAYDYMLSSDGSTLIGQSCGPVCRGFLWNVVDGTAEPLLIAGDYDSWVEDISADGSTVVGVSRKIDGGESVRGFVWNLASGLQALPVDSLPSVVSENGKTVIGHSLTDTGWQAFAWTAATGIRPLILDGHTQSTAYMVSDDGATVVGQSCLNGECLGVVWTESSGFLPLAIEVGQPFFPELVSSDGSTIVGTTCGSGCRPFRWTSSDGGQPLVPDDVLFATPNLVSSDGSTIVGYLCDSEGCTDWVWTESRGFELLRVGGDIVVVSKVSEDGSLLAGWSCGEYCTGFAWTAADGVFFPLILDGDVTSIAGHVSADGSIVVGYSCPFPDCRGFIWAAKEGISEVTLEGDTYSATTGVSPDGRTVIGGSCRPGECRGVIWRRMEVTDQIGPVSEGVLASMNPAPAYSLIKIVATLSDQNTGESTIAGGTLTISARGTYELYPSDGTFDEIVEDVFVDVGGLPAGVYELCISGLDSVGNTGAAECTTLAVYDPAAGFVTGGGWIWSPPGALAADASVMGRANFAFVSRYRKGANVPDGSTQFMFQGGDLKFHSNSYEWLVVTGNDYARFKGAGTINGANAGPGEAYQFMLWAGDGDPDTFRIKIWYEDDGEEVLVYDNGSNQPIGGGQIVIHTDGGRR